MAEILTRRDIRDIRDTLFRYESITWSKSPWYMRSKFYTFEKAERHEVVAEDHSSISFAEGVRLHLRVKRLFSKCRAYIQAVLYAHEWDNLKQKLTGYSPGDMLLFEELCTCKKCSRVIVSQEILHLHPLPRRVIGILNLLVQVYPADMMFRAPLLICPPWMRSEVFYRYAKTIFLCLARTFTCLGLRRHVLSFLCPEESRT